MAALGDKVSAHGSLPGLHQARFRCKYSSCGGLVHGSASTSKGIRQGTHAAAYVTNTLCYASCRLVPPSWPRQLVCPRWPGLAQVWQSALKSAMETSQQTSTTRSAQEMRYGCMVMVH